MAFATEQATCRQSFVQTALKSGGLKVNCTEKTTYLLSTFLTGVRCGFQTVVCTEKEIDLQSSGLTDLRSGGVMAFAIGKATYPQLIGPTAKSGGLTASVTKRKPLFS